jgi:hypothetical protein
MLVVEFTSVPNWDDFLRLPLREIRCCGAGSVQARAEPRREVQSRAASPSISS